jgi:hypothetical protein
MQYVDWSIFDIKIYWLTKINLQFNITLHTNVWQGHSMIITPYHITHDNDRKLRELSSYICKYQVLEKRENWKQSQDPRKWWPFSSEKKRLVKRDGGLRRRLQQLEWTSWESLIPKIKLRILRKSMSLSSSEAILIHKQ